MTDPATAVDPGSSSSTAEAVDDAFVDDLVAFVDAEVSQIDDPVVAETDLLLSGAVDSIGVMVIVDWLERRLSIRIDPGDIVLEHFQTIDLMVAYLRER